MAHPVDHADVPHEEIRAETSDRIAALIETLGNEDVLRRQIARERLTEIGRPAVPPLIEALEAPSEVVRWEAAKALQEIADPSAAAALVTALDDEDAGVRWVAAEALIAIGREGVVAVLHGLIERSDSEWYRERAHHVLRNFVRYKWGKGLVRVLRALDGIVPQLEAPVAAQKALYALEGAY